MEENKTLSIIKGVNIFFVVLGHCLVGTITEKLVNQVHLAAFFFASGFFFRIVDFKQYKLFFGNKILKLYIRFCLVCLLFLLLHNLFYYLQLYDTPLGNKDIAKELLRIFIFQTTNEPLAGAMWFCSTLLYLMITYWIVSNLSIRFNANVSVLVFMVFIISSICVVLKIKSPYCIWQVCMILPVYHFGYKVHNDLNDSFTYKTYLFPLCAVMILLATYQGYFAHLQPTSINNEMSLVLLFLPIVACIGMYSLALIMNEHYNVVSKLFALIGNHSFSIMAWHLLCFKIITFLQCAIYGFDLTELSKFPCLISHNGWFIAYLIVGVGMPIIMSYLYSKAMRAITLKAHCNK